MGLRLIPRSLRRSGFFVTVPGAMRSIVTELTPASRRQDHAALSSAASAFVLCATSGHRLPRPTSVTIAIRPSWWARDARRDASDLPDVTSESACDGLTRRANQLVHAKACQVLYRHSGARVKRASYGAQLRTIESIPPDTHGPRWIPGSHLRCAPE